jgi:hypothetical protein
MLLQDLVATKMELAELHEALLLAMHTQRRSAEHAAPEAALTPKTKT